MNKKSKVKKLTLSYETLRTLSEPQIRQVAGGESRFCTRFDCTDTYVCSGCAPCA